MAHIVTTDGAEIHYEIFGSGKPLVMLPGWSCSVGFFERNIPMFSESFQVVPIDLRGHGASPDPGYGHRISRYAADVREILEKLDLEDVTLLGWSMGGAIIWSYYELFGRHRIGKFVFVDQSPRQYLAPDWNWGSTGIYDCDALAGLIEQLAENTRGVAEGTVRGCYYGDPPPEDLEYLVGEIERSPGSVRGAIMTDHTNLDWRDLLPRITVPSLVIVGRHSSIFPWQGSAYVGETIPGAKTVFFEKSGHMPFWQESGKFNRVVGEFILT